MQTPFLLAALTAITLNLLAAQHDIQIDQTPSVPRWEYSYYDCTTVSGRQEMKDDQLSERTVREICKQSKSN